MFIQYATAKIGAILVNINPAYRTHELEYVLNQAGVRMLVAARSFKTSDYAAHDRRGPPGLPRAAATSCSSATRSGPRCVAAGRGGSAAQLAELQANLAADDPINIQYTSGTTGFPKGATLSHHNILNNGYFVGELCSYTEADRICMPVPFYHCFGMVMGNLAATTHGACMVIPAPGVRPGGDAARRWPRSAARRCTACRRCSSPSWPTRRSTTYDLSSLRTGIMAGSPCPVEVMKQVIERMGMAEVTICYGMTETSPVSTQTRADDDSTGGCPPSAGCTRTWRSRSSTRRPG